MMPSETTTGLLMELAAERTGPCISMYLATPPGAGPRAAKTRFEQLSKQAQSRLAELGFDQVEARALFAAASDLPTEVWAGTNGGMVAFLAAPGFFRAVAGNLSASEGVAVGSHFGIRPLLALLAEPERFYVLALSLNHVRLIEVTPDGPKRLTLGELDAGFAKAMGYSEFYSGLQAHSAGASGGGAARRPAILHGHGDHDEEKLEQDLRHWFGRIAKAVQTKAVDRAALRVLSTTTEHVALYAAASHDPLLLPTAVEGNPDHLTDAELAARARPLVAAALARLLQEKTDRWREHLGGPRASGDIETVLRLAGQGRVQSLYLPVNARLCGKYARASSRVELHPERRLGDEELLELAAIETLRNGGEVYELPDLDELGGAPLAALLRT